MLKLDWRQFDGEFRAETRFGIAIIVEHRQQPNRWLPAKQMIRYAIRLGTPSGAVLESSTDGYGPGDFGEFAAAEEFLLIRLAGLTEPPMIDPTSGTINIAKAEADYPGLAFTLDLCASYLPRLWPFGANHAA